MASNWPAPCLCQRPTSRWKNEQEELAHATYLFAVIDRAVITETAVFTRLNPRFRGARLRQASASFQHGVVARVSERLDAMRRARDATVRAQRSTGTALVLAKNRTVDDAFRRRTSA